jgi:hypothetical protein
LVCYIPGAIKGASIKLLDVNEVAIIMIILGEPQHPNFEWQLHQDYTHVIIIIIMGEPKHPIFVW